MSASNLVNSIGLICDIIGALVIWKFGLPEPLSRSGAVFLISGGHDENERAKAERYGRAALCGIVLLVGGFVLQLVSNFL